MSSDPPPLFPLADFLGMSIDVPGEGRATARLEVGERHRNPNGSTHGAVLFAMVDTAMGAAVLSVLAPEQRCASTDVHLRFHRSVAEGPIEASVTVTHRSRRTVSLDGQVTTPDGVLVASATGAFVVLDPR